MLALQLAGGPCFLLHWGLQGEAIAAGACALSMLLTLLAMAMDGPRARLARAAFLAALLPMAALVWAGWGGWPSAFAALGSALVCLARWQVAPSRMRLLMLASAVPWLVHDLALFSLPGMAADLLMLAQGVAVAWHRRRQRLPSLACARAALSPACAMGVAVHPLQASRG